MSNILQTMAVGTLQGKDAQEILKVYLATDPDILQQQVQAVPAAQQQPSHPASDHVTQG